MSTRPQCASEGVSADRMDMDSVSIDLEVYPVEAKRLDQAEDAFAEECVYAEGRAGLKEDR